jgi:hypothetical protein
MNATGPAGSFLFFAHHGLELLQKRIPPLPDRDSDEFAQYLERHRQNPDRGVRYYIACALLALGDLSALDELIASAPIGAPSIGLRAMWGACHLDNILPIERGIETREDAIRVSQWLEQNRCLLRWRENHGKYVLSDSIDTT